MISNYFSIRPCMLHLSVIFIELNFKGNKIICFINVRVLNVKLRTAENTVLINTKKLLHVYLLNGY